MTTKTLLAKRHSLRFKMGFCMIIPLTFCMAVYTYYNVRTNSSTLEEALLAKGHALARGGAASMAQVLEAAIDSGRLTRKQVFDTNYQPFDKLLDNQGKELILYHTAYDTYLDGAIQSIEDQIQKDPEVVFAVLVDKNGYLPTHNTNFSHKTRDYTKNRTKRLFNDPVGLKAAQNTNLEAPLKQVYKRDTGETMWDVSYPVTVKGQHWGGFRIGFSIDKMDKKVAAVTTRTIISMCLIVLTIIGIILLISGRISGPLKRAASVMAEVADNLDLNKRLEVRSEDEVGKMGRSFNFLMETFANAFKQMQEATDNVRKANINISSATAEQAASVTEQAASVAETTASVEEVRQTAEQSVERAQLVSEMASNTLKLAENGLDAVKKTEDGMSDLKEQVRHIAETILSLSEQTLQIGEIIATVNDIADQSNLLALNAAMEAARAGEAGRGFAVVAGEVRTLAEQSRQATAQVSSILNEIQKSAHTAVMVTEKGTKSAEGSVELAQSTGDSIRIIREHTQQVVVAAQQISASARQQLAGMDQITRAMENINLGATQTQKGMQQMDHTAQNLNDLARHLTSIVQQYKIG
jgi:methyl-accepting chemotaxis protein